MNDHLCTALVAASGDSGAGTTFHESSGRVWAFCKRNAIIHVIATLRGKLIGNRDRTILQH